MSDTMSNLIARLNCSNCLPFRLEVGDDANFAPKVSTSRPFSHARLLFEDLKVGSGNREVKHLAGMDPAGHLAPWFQIGTTVPMSDFKWLFSELLALHLSPRKVFEKKGYHPEFTSAMTTQAILRLPSSRKPLPDHDGSGTH
jgi:hypothetical protein